LERSPYKERKCWDAYIEAYEGACPVAAPWFIIPADCKWFRNLAVARIVVDSPKGLEIRPRRPPWTLPPFKKRIGCRQSSRWQASVKTGEHQRANRRNVMSIDPMNRSDDDVVREALEPMEEILATEEEELKKMDELINEAERKGKRILHPEPGDEFR
jgi:hypothetical protein